MKVTGLVLNGARRDDVSASAAYDVTESTAV